MSQLILEEDDPRLYSLHSQYMELIERKLVVALQTVVTDEDRDIDPIQTHRWWSSSSPSTLTIVEDPRYMVELQLIDQNGHTSQIVQTGGDQFLNNHHESGTEVRVHLMDDLEPEGKPIYKQHLEAGGSFRMEISIFESGRFKSLSYEEAHPESVELKKSLQAQEAQCRFLSHSAKSLLVTLDDETMADTVFVFYRGKENGKGSGGGETDTDREGSKGGDKGEKRIYAKMSVLKTLCEYFEDMFESGLKECTVDWEEAEGGGAKPLEWNKKGEEGKEDENGKEAEGDVRRKADERMSVSEESSTESEDEEGPDDDSDIEEDEYDFHPQARKEVNIAKMSQVPIRHAAYISYYALLYFLISGRIDFASIRSSSSSTSSISSSTASLVPSTDRRKVLSSLQEAGANEFGIAPCYPELCFVHIKQSLDVNNVVIEIFSAFSSTYDSVRKLQIQYLTEHWEEVKNTVQWKNLENNISPGQISIWREICESLRP
ncbi:hypothetical protein BT69DRAFT_372936 [Atractiella rhizophila]|nr:hypothetical protein BT69DRAFT_372936 [Atractiella rhizophila]